MRLVRYKAREISEVWMKTLKTLVYCFIQIIDSNARIWVSYVVI